WLNRLKEGKTYFTALNVFERPCEASALLCDELAMAAYREASAPGASEDSRATPIVTAADPSKPVAHRWEDITIRVLSDHRVQVVINDSWEPPRTYAELGFEDRRTKKPNRAWAALQDLSRQGQDEQPGPALRTLSKPTTASRTWPKTEKAI